MHRGEIKFFCWLILCVPLRILCETLCNQVCYLFFPRFYFHGV